jgi:hypothetical protein
VCTAGRHRCSDNDLQVCDSSGGAWTTVADCGDAGTCDVDAGQCDPIPADARSDAASDSGVADAGEAGSPMDAGNSEASDTE